DGAAEQAGKLRVRGIAPRAARLAAVTRGGGCLGGGRARTVHAKPIPVFPSLPSRLRNSEAGAIDSSIHSRSAYIMRARAWASSTFGAVSDPMCIKGSSDLPRPNTSYSAPPRSDIHLFMVKKG